MKVGIKNWKNQEVGEVDLPSDVFEYPYKEHLIHLAVQSVLAARRRGTHKTKVRSEVAGSGRKLWRQKGTGRARVGSIRTPLWRKGGIVHGPQPRSYENKLTVREKKNALKSVLSRKAAEERILVLDNFDLESHKTAELIRALRTLGLEDAKALLVDQIDNANLALAARNNPSIKAVDALAVNVYDVVDRPWLVMSRSALDQLVGVLQK
jgi:large subunit ribosomal protein L4